MLIPFVEGIWMATTAQSMYGLEVGARMTVIDLDGKGQLLVHSPIALNPDLKKQIDALGRVEVVIAPNLFHHLYIGNFKTNYPTAKFYCAPGLELKRKDFKFDGVITNEKNFPWNPYVSHLVITGSPKLNEVVFHHNNSKTLLITDLALHICYSPSLFTRIVFKMIGAYGKFGWAKAEKILFISDRVAFRKSIDDILKWDFDKVLMCHGRPLTTDGKQQLKQAFATL